MLSKCQRAAATLGDNQNVENTKREQIDDGVDEDNDDDNTDEDNDDDDDDIDGDDIDEDDNDENKKIQKQSESDTKTLWKFKKFEHGPKQVRL